MNWNRQVVIGAVLVVLLGLLVYGFWPEATPVTIERAERDSLRVTVEEEGITQLRQPYVVTAPTSGFLKRVAGEVGDSVARRQVLARLATLPAKVLDASDYQAAEAQAAAARAALQRAQKTAEGTQAARSYAQDELQRIQRLREQGTASQQQLDRARLEFQQAEAEHAAAQQTVAQAQHEVEAAESRLARTVPPTDALAPRVAIQAPADGRLLKVHQRSAGVVQAGTPLFTLGNPDSLEVSVEVLSSDAVEIAEGMPVELTRWRRGSAPMLPGRVRRVSPQGQTEVSALGVEEQRVEVIVDPAGSPAAWEPLGTGYRVVARFILWSGADVLQVPQSALFPHEDGWAVFAVRDGRARLQPVEIGHRSGLRAQVLDGLAAGDRVVTHPADELSDGTRVEAR